MSEQVMRVSNIGKKYELMTEQDKHDTFASVLLNSFKGGFKKKKNKGEFWALKDVSFNVNKGERIGIIGHNGAGKSTLLKVFSRITVPTEGEIEVKGKMASLLEVGTGFHMELTGRENIYLNGSILGMSRSEIDAKFDDIVEFSEIGQFLDTPVKRYSSGMFVKLAFAVASHLDPDILIVDEVLAVGDMKFQEKCLGKMEDVASGGRTIIYVSHSMRTVQQLCTRVIVMNHGKIIYDGDVNEGVKIYMENTKSPEIYNDLSLCERDSTITKKIKMNSVEILNKDNCMFTNKEKIKFKLNWKSSEKIENLYLRLIIHYADNTPAGMCISPEINDESECIFNFGCSNIAPGKYLADLIMFESNKSGAQIKHDIVKNAFTFELVQENGTIHNLEWWHNAWGHTHYTDLTIE